MGADSGVHHRSAHGRPGRQAAGHRAHADVPARQQHRALRLPRPGRVGPDVDDPALTELIGELSLKSDAFRRLRARHDVRARANGTKRINRPIVGQVDVRYETFVINGTDGQTLVVYHCEPGSASAQALGLLSSMIAGEIAEPANGRPPR
jgi:hypothetical protein